MSLSISVPSEETADAFLMICSFNACAANGAQKYSLSSVNDLPVDFASVPIFLVNAVMRSLAFTVFPVEGATKFPVKMGMLFANEILSCCHSVMAAICLASSFNVTVLLSLSATSPTASIETSGIP